MNSNIISMEQHRLRKEVPIYLQVPGNIVDTGTRPFPAHTSDGNVYWCKRFVNDHGRESTINEVVASEIGKRIGARVREWAVIHVPDTFVGYRVGDSTRRYSLDGTPLFGSLNLDGAVLESAPQAIHHVLDDSNHNEIPKLIALWALCNVQEDLQFLYDTNNDYEIWSIDHGFWFDSLPFPWQLSPVEQMAGRIQVPQLTARIPAESWDKAIAAIGKLDSSLIDEICGKLPDEWEVTRAEIATLVNYAIGRIDYARDILNSHKQAAGRR
ncbi:HipA family kinase [Corynebacterium diphtheriae]|uniref:HipA family kinase n=1 Tax=Corynebacterium diphtheriae TaxID=1717 RepID=UPI000A708447|nr:HipA family kinase [Corynebacterium diphtheriae]